MSLTTTELLAAASDILTNGDYRLVEDATFTDLFAQSVRVFEDRYSVVAVVVYETWQELAAGWPDAQSSLVELMSKFVTRAEAKAWDGYLVLLTPGFLPVGATEEINTIRYDTSRVRKLVSTGDGLRTVSDAERALYPLLPIQTETLPETESALDLLPNLLARRGVPEGFVRTVIDAFTHQEPILERLHDHVSAT